MEIECKTELLTNLAKTIRHTHSLITYNQHTSPKINFYAVQVQTSYRIDQLENNLINTFNKNDNF